MSLLGDDSMDDWALASPAPRVIAVAAKAGMDTWESHWRRVRGLALLSCAASLLGIVHLCGIRG
jgi:hypothetical protein